MSIDIRNVYKKNCILPGGGCISFYIQYSTGSFCSNSKRNQCIFNSKEFHIPSRSQKLGCL